MRFQVLCLDLYMFTCMYSHLVLLACLAWWPFCFLPLWFDACFRYDFLGLQVLYIYVQVYVHVHVHAQVQV